MDDSHLSKNASLMEDALFVKDVYNSGGLGGLRFSWPSSSPTITLKFTSADYTEKSIQVQEELLTERSKYFKLNPEAITGHDENRQATLPGSFWEQQTVTMWLFQLWNPTATAHDLALFAMSLPNRGPDLLLEWCKLWVLAKELGDPQSQDLTMDAIVPVHRYGLPGESYVTPELEEYITRSGLFPVNTGPYKWLVHHVAYRYVPSYLDNLNTTTTPEFRALAWKETMSLRSPNLTEPKNCVYYVRD